MTDTEAYFRDRLQASGFAYNPKRTNHSVLTGNSVGGPPMIRDAEEYGGRGLVIEVDTIGMGSPATDKVGIIVTVTTHRR